MTIEPGKSLLHYRIVEKIGQGGMGVVWRAADTVLDRDVAIKVLPDARTLDAERLARFEREAKLLASLNHANIATVYGLHDTDGMRFIAMELVEGEDLARRMERGPLPIDDATRIAGQIAEALEAAHDRGVIHRDLKPANVRMTAEGKAKVLDFGLAKALVDDRESGSDDPSASPTATSLSTRAGVILGSAAYMSPEQARGEAVDERSDIFAFGALLYEMITGARAFDGGSVSETLAEVLKDEVDWSRLPARTPPSVRRCLRRCLHKDPRQRLRHIADARLELEDIGAEEEAGPAVPPPASSRWPWAVALVAIALALVCAGLAWYLGTRPTVATDERVVRFSIAPAGDPPGTRIRAISFAPDERHLAYTLIGAKDDRARLHSLESGLTELLAGTEGAGELAFSPDGESLAFWTPHEIRWVKVTGGRPELVTYADRLEGLTWASDDLLLFAETLQHGLKRADLRTGEVERLTVPVGSVHHLFPMTLPGSDDVLFTTWTSGDHASLELLSAKDGSRSLALERGRASQLVGPEILAYVREGWLEIAPFDRHLGRVLDGVSFVGPIEQTVFGGAMYSVTQRGSLAYVPGVERETALAVLDGSGKILRLQLHSHRVRSPRVSADGKRLSVSLEEERHNLWLYDIARQTRRRLTDAMGDEWWHTWIDERRIVLQSNRRTGDQLDLYVLDVDGTKGLEPLVESTGCSLQPQEWVPSTEELVYTLACPGEANIDVWRIDLDDREPKPVLTGAAREMHASVSPDGRWLVYASNASGSEQVFLTSYPEPDRIVQVSPGRGRAPKWSGRGSEIVYEVDNGYAAVSFAADPEPTIGSPRPVHDGLVEPSRPWGRGYDAFPDGERLLIKVPVGAPVAPEIRVVLNWRQEVARALEDED